MVYSAVAVVLGISLTLLPLLTLTFVETRNISKVALQTKFEQFEGAREESLEDSLSDLEVLALCFIIALLAYLIIRRKHPHRTYRRMGDYLYYF